MERINNDLGTKLKVRKKFKAVTKSDGGCGNVRVGFKDSKAKILQSDEKLDSEKLGYISDYMQISSALALYRAISLFQCSIKSKQVDHCKMNWIVHLKHVETGLIISLGEWKGGFQIFTPAHTSKELPKSFIKDVEEMLTLLVSDKLTIGYDGVVAGSVA